MFFDFKKAFNTVPHRKLMNVLCEIDTHPVLLSWLCSYLSLRQQYVMVNGEHSERCHVLSGVPQGSVLAGFYLLGGEGGKLPPQNVNLPPQTFS